MDMENERILLKVRAETMYFNTIRRGRYTLVLTDKRVLLKSIFGVKREFLLEEIDSVECYKVALLLPFGVRFRLRSGEMLEVAAANRRALVEELEHACSLIKISNRP